MPLIAATARQNHLKTMFKGGGIMEKAEFEAKLRKAMTFYELGKSSDYWCGYVSGLRRRYYGENFGTEGEHDKRVSLVNDESRRDMGCGYREGYGMPMYCVQNDGDCETCSLVNYGRDCQNNPIEGR